MSAKPLCLKTPAEYSSGLAKLPLGRIDPRIGRIKLNLGKGMAIRDSTWNKSAANIDQGKTIDLKIRSNAVTDVSGNSNHPTLSNVSLLDGEMQFNEATSIATIAHSATFKTVSFSVFCRVKFGAAGSSLGRIFESTPTFNKGVYCYRDGASHLLYFSLYSSGNTYTSLVSASYFDNDKVYDLCITHEQYAGSGLGRLQLYVNGVLDASQEDVYVHDPGTVNFTVGNRPALDRGFQGSIYVFRMHNYALSASEVKALSDGKIALYPSQDSLNYTITQTTVKDLQWFIRNPTSTIEVAPIILFDEGEPSFWSVESGGSGGTTATPSLVAENTVKAAGSNSLLLSFADATKSWSDIYHTYGTNQNWSAYDVIFLYVYGSNSGHTLGLQILTKAVDLNNYYTSAIVDNFIGWQRITLLLRAMAVGAGTPDLTQVRQVRIVTTSFAGNHAIYLDRGGVDVCPSIPVKKLSLDGLYVENQLEESAAAGDVLQVFDDDGLTFWSSGSTSEADEATIKVKGALSYKFYSASPGQYSGLDHAYGVNQDWSGFDFISFYWYGANTGNTWVLTIRAPDTSNRRTKTIVDNWTGWKRFVIPILSMTPTGSPNMATVLDIQLYVNDVSPVAFTHYLDRMVLQKGRWAFLEVALPDLMYSFQNFLSGSPSMQEWVYWTVKFWDGAVYGGGTTYDNGFANASKYLNPNTSKFLDAQTLKAVFGDVANWDTHNSFCHFVSGLRGQTKGRVQAGLEADQSIAYNGVGGCKRRIGFAIKMPPANGLANLTTGISQVKLKLEVYVP